ncbi:hypothetical protein BH10BAC1_BH10BAC1_10690 [soil metagenome]
MNQFLKKTLILTVAFLFVQLFAFSQEPEVLKVEMERLKGKEKVDVYLKIGNLFSEKYGAADSLLHYSELALTEAVQLKYQQGINRARLNRALAFQQKNNFDSATVNLEKLLFELIDADQSDFKGDVCYALGLSHYRSGNNKLAIEYFIKAVSVYVSTKNRNGLALSYCKLSGVFINEHQIIEAIAYKNRALKNVPFVTDPYTKISVYSALSGIYIQIDNTSSLNADSSVFYAKEALSIMKEFGYYTKANQICNSISDVYYLRKEYVKSLEYCKESLKYRKYLFPGEIIISYLKYADCSNALKQNENALLYLDSVAFALKSIDDQFYKMIYYERVYNYNKDAGKYVEALVGLEHFKAIQDSMFNVDKTTAINDLIQKYDKVENEKKITELNRENEISSLNVKFLVVGIVATISVIIIIVFFYRQSVLRNKFKMLESEQRLNRARMNPHFFFNALTSIQSLSEDVIKQKEVPRLISKFSKIMRQSLESTYEELVSIEEEVDFIQSYVELQKTRYPNKFDFNISVLPVIDAFELKIPSMLLQPFIENSIEHGFKNLNYQGILEITISLVNNQLKVVCRDNGRGLIRDENSKTFPSRATQIIKERLLLLNKRHNSTSSVEVRNIESGGVEVVVFLPVVK